MQSIASFGILENDSSLGQTLSDYFLHFRKQQVSFYFRSYDELQNNRERLDQPQLILLDIHLDDSNGIQLLPKLRQDFPFSPVLVMTGDQSSHYIKAAIENGACGYLIKPFSMATLENAIEGISANGSYLDTTSSCRLVRLMQNPRTSQNTILEKLTKTEELIAHLLLDGNSTKEIALSLSISNYSVYAHMQKIYYKLNVRSKKQLVKMLLD